MKTGLEDKVVVITGAASGIGAASARVRHVTGSVYGVDGGSFRAIP